MQDLAPIKPPPPEYNPREQTNFFDKMGAPFWSKEENRYFIHSILPRSQYASGSFDAENGETFDELAPVMQAALDAQGTSRRQYTGYMLFQHWYQKISPRSHERGEARAESAYPAHPVEKYGQVDAPEAVRDAVNRAQTLTTAGPAVAESATRSTATPETTSSSHQILRFKVTSSRESSTGLPGTESNEQHAANKPPPRTAKEVLEALSKGAKKRRAQEEKDDLFMADKNEEESLSDVEYKGEQPKRAKRNARHANLRNPLTSKTLHELTQSSTRPQSPPSPSQPSYASTNSRHRVARYGTPPRSTPRQVTFFHEAPTQISTYISASVNSLGNSAEARAVRETSGREISALDILSRVAAEMPRIPTAGVQGTSKATSGSVNAQSEKKGCGCPHCGGCLDREFG